MKINEKIGLHRYIGRPRQIVRIMKITILLMTVCLLQVSALTKAQISIDAKQESLREVLKKISQQSGYDFIYSVSDFKDAKPVDLKLNNVSLDVALRAAFYSQPLIYEVSDKTVMVRKKEEKTYIQTVIDRFQAIDVRGKVVDSLGNGLAGATVSVKGGKGSTSTDNNGSFYLKNVEENMLVVNYLGYVSKEVSVQKDYLFITLKQSSSKLDEIQVIAYGNTSRRLSTGNIVTIKQDEISRQVINNPLLALQGKVPNLIITPQSGDPNAKINIQLRGQNSLGDNSLMSEPLIVIDGLPFQNNLQAPPLGKFGGPSGSDYRSALSFFNPKDIESIDVLSDADATSIYGSRGGNGVILITTRGGSTGPVKLTASVQHGYSQLSSSAKLKLLNTEQYLQMRREAYTNDNVPIPTNTSQFNNSNFDLTLWDQSRYTDWQDVFLGGHPKWTEVNASISGGSQYVNYMINGHYKKQGYIYPTSLKDIEDACNNQGSLQFMLTGKSKDGKFSVSLRNIFTNTEIKESGGDATSLMGYAMRLAPNAPELYDENGNLNWEPNIYSTSRRASWVNPFSQFYNPVESVNKMIITHVNLSYRITPDLSLLTTGGFTNTTLDQQRFITLASKDPSTYSSARGEARYQFVKSSSVSVDPRLSYLRVFKQHRVSALAGLNLQNQINQGRNNVLGGYTDDALIRDYSFADPSYGMNTNSTSEYRYFGLFGRIGYDYASKYLLNINIRRDGSSRFGPANLYGNYFSIGAAWVFSDEVIIKNAIPALSFGKLRMSYGTSGNDGIGDYNYLELYENTGDGSYQGIKTLKSLGVNNPEFSWETVKKAEIGLELGFLSDKILLNTSYWRTRSSDQLGAYLLPATGGAYSVFYNQSAKIQNSGWDFILRTSLRSKDFSWDISANYGIQKNKLLSLPESFASYYNSTLYKLRNEDPVGHPFANIIFVSEYRGVDPTSGIYSYSDKNGNATTNISEINPVAKRISLLPKLIGLSNSITYKRLSLNFDLQFARRKGENFLYSGNVPGRFNSSGSEGNQLVNILNRWTTTNRVTNIQKFTQSFGDAYSNYLLALRNSDIYYVDIKYLRLNNVVISYRLSENLLKRINLSDLSVNIGAQNLFTITDYKGFDPQIGGLALPSLRTITAGVSLTF